jgi:hypothetical protein
VIQVDSEQMLVTALTSAGGGKYNLTVTRAYNSTTAAVHTSNAQIIEMVTSYPGTATNPVACTVSSGTIGATTTTLAPGTYYGGICIGAAD